MLLSFLAIRTSARLMRSPKVPWWPGSIETGRPARAPPRVRHRPDAAGGLRARAPAGQPLVRAHGGGVRHRGGTDTRRIRALAAPRGRLLVRGGTPLRRRCRDRGGRRRAPAAGLPARTPTDGSAPAAIIAYVLLNLAICGVAVFKGKVVMGVAGILFPLVGFIGAIRLAKPHSPWATALLQAGQQEAGQVEGRATSAIPGATSASRTRSPERRPRPRRSNPNGASPRSDAPAIPGTASGATGRN